MPLQLSAPLEERPAEGQLLVGVIETRLTSHRARPGQPDAGGGLTRQVSAAHAALADEGAQRSQAAPAAAQVGAALLKSGAVDLAQLCVSAGKVAWTAHLDVYVLAADGALLDAVLLAAAACLSTLRLPFVPLTSQGTVRPADTLQGAAAGQACCADANASP